MIKFEVDMNKIGSLEIKGDIEDIGIEFSKLFEHCIRNGVPVALLGAAMIQACCQGKVSDEEFSQIANTVSDMLKVLENKYFDK